MVADDDQERENTVVPIALKLFRLLDVHGLSEDLKTDVIGTVIVMLSEESDDPIGLLEYVGKVVLQVAVDESNRRHGH